MDIFDKLRKDRGPLGKFSRSLHNYIFFPKLEGEIGPWMEFKGKRMLNWSLNNYLGLANHPEVRKADTDATAEFGLAYPMGARMMSGNSIYHEQLERDLSDFMQKEDTFLLNFGYQGIMSVIDALLDRRDVVVYDSEAHACIIDGLRMHSGKRFVYPHNDMISFEKQMVRATKLSQETGGGILVITEGVFGMSGDQGRLKEIVDFKDTYNFRLLVDDAHGFGTMGATGAGTGENQNCQDGIDIYFSTFAKSMASIGAFVSADADIIEYLRYNTRSQIYAKSLPMPLVIGAIKRLELLRTMPELRQKLWDNVDYLQQKLKENGFNIGPTTTPVTPVIIETDENQVSQMTIELREKYGIFCSPVTYPVIPKGLLILRLIPTAMHTHQDVDITIPALKEVVEKLGQNFYATTNFVVS